MGINRKDALKGLAFLGMASSALGIVGNARAMEQKLKSETNNEGSQRRILEKKWENELETIWPIISEKPNVLEGLKFFRDWRRSWEPAYPPNEYFDSRRNILLALSDCLPLKDEARRLKLPERCYDTEVGKIDDFLPFSKDIWSGNWLGCFPETGSQELKDILHKMLKYMDAKRQDPAIDVDEILKCQGK